MPVTIRPYRPDDLDALYDVCLRTADAGEDATDLVADPRLFGAIYAAPYAVLAPDLAFVAEDDSGVGGYIVGTDDTVAFDALLERSWWPALRAQHPEPAPGPGTLDDLLVTLIHHPPPNDPAIAAQYPAHLHIDLLPRLRGQGVGRRLMDTFVDALRARAVRGVHFGVSVRNERAQAFYRHLGFEPVGNDGISVVFAKRFDPTVDDAVMSGALWSQFCAALQELGEFVLRDDATANVLDRAEGYRYLTRLLRAGLESMLERTDAAHPVVSTLPNLVKIGADNPDNLYQTITIDGRREYRVRGRRGTVHYLGIGAYGGGGRAGASSGERAGYLEDHQLEVGPGGKLEIVCSAREQPGNWLRLRPDSRQLIIRQSFLDRDAERPAELQVECLSDVDPYPQLDGTRLAHGLLGAVAFAKGTAETFERWTGEFMERPNELHQRPADELATNWSDPNITFYHGYWTLQPGEALVVTATPPPCDYWNFQLNNWWMESLDYRFLRVTCNAQTAVHEPDGSVRIVIAAADPGFGNWMDTAGHHHGTMGLRWVRASADVQPTTEVMPTSARRAPDGR